MKVLNFDPELATALGGATFPAEDVTAAFQKATSETAQVGIFPSRGQTQFEIHPLLNLTDGQYRLYVVACDNEREAPDPEYAPSFNFTLITARGDEMTSSLERSSDGSTTPYVVLLDSSDLIDAQLMLLV